MPLEIRDTAGKLLHTHDTDAFGAANLAGLNLRGADFQEAILNGSDNPAIPSRCVGAILDGSDCEGADFRGADLSRASFKHTILRGARFEGARLPYGSHDVISEVLRQNAGDDLDKLDLAELILSRRDLCWWQFRAMNHPAAEWAIKTIRSTRRSGDWQDNPTVPAACNDWANGYPDGPWMGDGNFRLPVFPWQP